MSVGSSNLAGEETHLVLLLLIRVGNDTAFGSSKFGKTTLLLALAGELGKDLKVSGNVTYNGHGMHGFVPQRSVAYISQHDVHIGEMTVGETLAFSARCQGAATLYMILGLDGCADTLCES
ncbi:putative P-loop containing nucleoside triphosphate hydrolase [Rosa chinensis]|uniref:Putative P-loop containing nucleoside triphosphate hydrolase n=1 Tax=Rosa chinensis TaxID=74649 RepID=A0A2P6PUT1_ROSCH|nr:putative P-loop containing nucleoside triphosphate hydrolase [Rosa chinensis]